VGIFTRKNETAADAFDDAGRVIDDISGDYTLDPSHTRVGFSARHAMVTTVRGSFKEVEGTAHVDTADPARSTIALTIKAASIDTGNADRDAHLRSGDFLEHEAFPDITFQSTDVSYDGAEWTVTGDLTIKGVAKPVTVVFEETGSTNDPWGNTRVGFEGSATISRTDWGITWNAALETGGVLVSDKVKLEFDVAAVKTA
jgi:polyisoprenoid-binding protein YceI